MLILLSYILVIALSLKRHPTALNLSNIHFNSSTQTFHEFELTNLDSSKALVIIPKLQEDYYGHNKSITPAISLKINNLSCNINSTSSYCLVSPLKSKRQILNSTCLSTPCSVSLQSYQTIPINKVDTKMPLQRAQLIQINRKQGIIMISCNDSTIKQFSNELLIRTNTKHNYIDKGNKIFIVFDDPIKQLIIQSTQKGSKCGSYDIVFNPISVKLNSSQKIVVVDIKKINIEEILKDDLQLDIDMMSSDNISSKARISVFIESFPPTLLMSSQIEDIKQTKIFNLIIKKSIIQKYNKSIYIEVNPHNHSIIGSFNPIQSNTHILQINQVSFFNLTLNQQIAYKLYQTEDNMLVNITSTVLGNISLTSGNRTTNQSNLIFKCTNKSCQFKIKSLSNQSIGYIQLLSSIISKHQINYQTLTNSLKLRMKQDQIKYLIIKRQPIKQLLFIHVSSPNIITYIGGDICPQPSATCHDYSGSDMTPIAIQTQQSTLYVSLQALQTSSFEIRIQNSTNKYVELRDSIPMNINFKQDTSILFSYKIQQIQTVYFNLLSTPSMFTMYIQNSKQTPDQNSRYKSNSYIKIDKQDIVQKQFTIMIKRIGKQINQKVTIIASNTQSIITIDKNSPYYDNFQVGLKKYYLLVLDANENKVRISLQITPLFNKYNLSVKLGPRKDYMMHNLTVINSFNSLNLDKQIQKICDQSDNQQFCQIFIQLQNNGDKQIDTTFTITVNQAIIQLKSGIWFRYAIGSSQKYNQFYFIPKNKRNIFIQFNNIYMNYKLEYKLWNNSLKQINKQLWPFPTNMSNQDNKHGITIFTKQIQNCYPNCVVLITVTSALTVPFTYSFMRFMLSFSLMISDSILELKQTQRSTITLLAKQSKFMIVDLSQHIKQQEAILTFTTNRIVGSFSIIAKVAGDEYQPPSYLDHQYNFNGKYTQIKISDIISNNHQAKQLILMVTGTSVSLNGTTQQCVFSISYTTSSSIIKPLPMSMLTTLRLQPRSSELYKIQFWKQYRIKIIRKQGFPFISYSECPQDNIDKCIENIDKRQMQIVSKIEQIKPTNSSNMMLLKIISKNQLILVDILAVSKDMSIRLLQGVIFNDYGQKQEINRYNILAFRTKQTKIFITVYQGFPTATIKSPLDSLQLNGTLVNNLITFVLSPSMFQANISLFTNLQLSLVDTNMNCSYSITYTLNNNIQLIDGLVTAGTIKSKQNITYIYNDKLNDKMTVSLTFETIDMLKSTKILIIQSGDQNVTLQPQTKHIFSNTPHPTIIFNLQQNYTSYQIVLQNQDQKKDVNYNISINYVDIILLPLNYQYPILLKQQQSMNMIVEIENQAVIQFYIKKCNDEDLTFLYSQDKEQFKSGKYSNQIEIEQPIHTSRVHVKSSTLYIKVSSQTGVLLAVKVRSVKNQKSLNVKAGNQGLIQYTIKQQHKANIQFTPVVCHDKCPKPIKYEYVLGANLKEVEAQTICQSSFFLTTNQTLLMSQPINPKKSQQQGKLMETITIKEDMQYLGFRAILPDGDQVPYQVIELSTIWGQIQKHTNRHFWPFFLLTGLLFCCCFVGLRFQNRRKGKYEPLPQ